MSEIEGLLTAISDWQNADRKVETDVMFLRLRHTWRQLTSLTQTMKLETAQEKDKCDIMNLKWQNLDYERRHLERELDSYINSK